MLLLKCHLMRVTTMIVCDDEVDGGGGEAAMK